MAISEYDKMASWYDKVLEPFLWKMRRKIVAVSNVHEGMKNLNIYLVETSVLSNFKTGKYLNS